MKPLLRIPASDVPALTRALETALDGGPAVWPLPTAATPAPAAPAPAAPGPTIRSGGAFVPEQGPIGAEFGTNAPPEGNVTPVEVDDRIALVVETSGSTDAPKRVALSADALVASADATHDALGGTGQWLLALPGHYIAGAQVLVRGLVASTPTLTVPGERFDPSAFAATSAQLLPHVPHYTSLVPTQLARLLDAAERDPFIAAALTSFDAVLVGGQALAPAIAERAAAAGVRIVRTYGSSETAGGCVYDGTPIGDTRLRFDDGRIELASSSLADGYLGDPARTAEAFRSDRDGTRWYVTGDLGELAADGRLRVRGRADDVMVSGGVKVVLGEVERVVRAVAGFADAVVVAAPDPEWGERAAVAIAGDAGDEASALQALRTATDAAGLAPAARPVRLVVVDRLPMLASGKPDRRAIAALAAASAG
ncbi:o-succinylbenzoate--CoA ligase [Agromyces humatus]|uniref:O-succinylbenzoate--CoA ligase n=1 Tax=Agromyces humatus TaxID=279573 RepID=A0ABP4X8J8_9MICO